MSPATTATPQPQAGDHLQVAYQLVRSGMPVFIAPPNPDYDAAAGDQPEFKLPVRWPGTPANPELLARWEPGWALCLVTGHGLDAVDIDPANGGVVDDQLARLTGFGATVLGIADTPSGGAHLYVLSTGLATSANTKVGVDYRGGRDDATGAGFLYLPGTRRPKYGGSGYTWRSTPDLGLLGGLDRGDEHSAVHGYLKSLGSTPTGGGLSALPRVTAEPVDLASLPRWLQVLLTDFGPVFTLADGTASTDRSARFHHLVGACHRAGLSQGEAVFALTKWCEEVD